ncbi:MAG: peptidase domain-containing ABC transporter [Muribaculaceae bacterium]|nr:peptidase domain-containing ABC transporter [Muribaculaceae bacterium]
MQFTRQQDTMQCGAACLTMICNHFGIRKSLNYIAKLCNPAKDGLSMLAIANAADKLNFETATVQTSVDRLKQLPLPAILHWNQNHFVVLHKISKHRDKFHIADPGKGKITYSRSEFEQHWLTNSDSGVVMLFHHEKSTADYKTKKDGRNLPLKFLLKYFIQYRHYFFQIFLGLLLGCFLQLLLPFLTQSIVDIGIVNNNINVIKLILLGEVIIIISQAITDFLRRWILLHVSMRINISLISDFFIKILRLPMSFFDTKLTGDLIQRMSDHNRIQNFLTTQALGFVFTIISFIILGIVLLIYNTTIFSIFIFSSLLYALWIWSFLKKRKIIDYCQFEQQSINQNKTYQFFTNIQEIKLQNCERRRRHEWEDVQAELFLIQMRSLKLQQTLEAGNLFINELKNIIITFVTAYSVISGNMTLGAMLAIQFIIGQLNSPVRQIMEYIYALQDVKISLERINDIHEQRTEEELSKNITVYHSSDKNIIFENVCFKYNTNDISNVLNHISVEIENKKVTAIIGPSGSGKSTLIKLMLGYYNVECGTINVAGLNLTSYNMKWWRDKCGAVLQDGAIFSESIARNIAIDDNDINSELLIESAKMANIHDYIMSLPLGYNTIIGNDGIGLSQGQKQRILIARAIYKQPDFLFLDEATNALDANNEMEIVTNLSQFFKGRTVIIVAHRLSTVKNADKILVLNNGSIVESGKHEDLIKLKSHYFNLVKNQLELGL